jgi:prepilin-type N-terminal cleavage/methylation domain-containing protein
MRWQPLPPSPPPLRISQRFTAIDPGSRVATLAVVNRGFSLVEVLIATTVTTIGTVALAQLCAISIRMNQDARATTLATLLASQKMEQLRALAWTSDALGVPISDFATDTTVVPHTSSGGTGLTASPPGALNVNTPGYCDFLDENGRALGGGTAPHAAAAFVRRWSITPVAPAATDTLAIQVSVVRVGSHSSVEGTLVSGPGEVRLFGIKARKG